jgi:hypothetical protein
MYASATKKKESIKGYNRIDTLPQQCFTFFLFFLVHINILAFSSPFASAYSFNHDSTYFITFLLSVPAPIIWKSNLNIKNGIIVKKIMF